jgi:hypothetical protein
MKQEMSATDNDVQRIFYTTQLQFLPSRMVCLTSQADFLPEELAEHIFARDVIPFLWFLGFVHAQSLRFRCSGHGG